MTRWFKKARKLIAEHWRALLDWYIEWERLRQIKRREELGDL